MSSGYRWPIVLVALCGLGAAACASIPAVTSGQIGCAERDIVITDDEVGWATRTWTAECHGKRYFCSAHGGGGNSTPQVSCTPANDQPTPTAVVASAPAAAPAAKDGCKFDTQCKGDRVCRDGACADP
jgi:hypothetical protein